MACTCLDDFDAKLKDHNTKLVRTFVFRPSAADFPTIATEKINTRLAQKVISVPTYCPFCGVAYALEGGKVEVADVRPH